MSDEEYISDEEFLANLKNIDNEKLIQSLQSCGHDGYYNDLYYPIIEEIKRRLSLSPSAEPERKIIYCKDCKFAHLTIKGRVKYCDVWFPETKTYLGADDFCSSAEKRGE